MKNTLKRETDEEAITLTMENFIATIGAGRHTANKIAEQAETMKN